MTLKEYRISQGITALNASTIINVPLRTYVRYENDNDYGSELKREGFLNELKKNFYYDEFNGIYEFESIKNKLNSFIEENYKDHISFVYLFGSYAKGYARENSDIDLCIDTDLKGLDLVGLNSDIHDLFSKNVDLVVVTDLKNNLELLKEIMMDGIKIYG